MRGQNNQGQVPPTPCFCETCMDTRQEIYIDDLLKSVFTEIFGFLCSTETTKFEIIYHQDHSTTVHLTASAYTPINSVIRHSVQQAYIIPNSVPYRFRLGQCHRDTLLITKAVTRSLLQNRFYYR